MTEKQTTFITSLAKQKATGTLTPEQQQYIAQIMAGHVNPTVEQASRIITALLALADRETRTANTSPAVRDVPAGRYAIEVDGVVKFFLIDKPTEGKWAGRTFVSAQASDEKWPIRNADTRDSILAKISEDPHGAMIRYGHEIGCCGRCGRTLTDETSRAMGIGPECAKILGIVSTPNGEQGAEEAAPSADEPTHYVISAEAIIAAAETDSPVEETQEPADEPVAPQEPAQGRTDPSAAMTWRQRKAAVEAQQADTKGKGRDYPGMRRAAAGVADQYAAPFTVKTDGGAEVYTDGAEAYLAGMRKWQEAPLAGAVTIVDATGTTVAHFEF